MTNWKDLGIELTRRYGSMMCPMHEHQTALVMQEVRQTCELLDEALGERNRYREQARHWKNVAGLALVALVGVFVLAVFWGAK